MIAFPDGFAWGVATASYQIEGAVSADGRGPSIWDTFSHTPGKIVNDEPGDVANDHYHRYLEDVALMADMNLGYYRFSIAWPRVQPDGRGAFNEAGLDFYSRLIDALLDKGIRPWVTLYHWDLPQSLEDAGGWPVRETAERFAEYAIAVCDRFKDRVRFWTTLNEPWCSAFLGYSSGTHAPGRTEPAASLKSVHHLLLGHGLAAREMRGSDVEVGITLNPAPIRALTDSPADQDAARRIDGLRNRIFLDPLFYGRYPGDVLDDVASIVDTAHIHGDDEKTIAVPLDFLGINYYNTQIVRKGVAEEGPGAAPGSADVESVPQGLPTSDMGWEIEPSGLRDLLARIHRDYPGIPLYVTENGIALRDEVVDGVVSDPDRIAYIDGHLRAAHQAISDGIDLRGYFVWTFTDNFEWSFGTTKRFGLVYVDYPTQRRIPKASAAWYAQVTHDNALDVR